MNNTQNAAIVNGEQSIYALFGEQPQEFDEVAEETAIYRECEIQEYEDKAFAEEHLNADKLSRFAKLKLEAKAAGDKDAYALLVEHERNFKASMQAKEREAKATAKEEARKQKEALKAQEQAELDEEKAKLKAAKDEERKAQQALKAHLAKLAADEPTPELVYAMTTGANPNLAVYTREENVTQYEWTGTYWKQLTRQEGRARAFDWLAKNFPNMAGNKHAANAFESSLFYLKELPAKPTKTIIPLKNVWIEVSDKGLLRLVKPDKAIGVTYNINAHLNFKECSRFYTPKAVPETSMFYRFITTSLPDPEVRDLVQEYLGYTLLSSAKYQQAQVWEGTGSNGKSVMLAIIKALHEHPCAVNLDKLQPFDLAPLKNASLAISAETPKGQLDENTLKACIAGDAVSMCNKYQMAFTHEPTAKWIMSCNRFPRIQDDSNGVFRRLQYISWSAVFEGKDIINDLHMLIIENELDVVVDWCLAGIQRLEARQRFAPPASVVAKLEAEKVASNSVLAFIKDGDYITDPTLFATDKNKFYQSYEQWAEDSGSTSYGGGEFWKRVKTILPGLQEMQKTVNSKRLRYVNIKIK